MTSGPYPIPKIVRREAPDRPCCPRAYWFDSQTRELMTWTEKLHSAEFAASMGWGFSAKAVLGEEELLDSIVAELNAEGDQQSTTEGVEDHD